MGLEAAGFALAWLCEKDPQCRKVLAHHWPGVTIYHDLEGLADCDLEPVDLLAGGTPCQDLSVAGRRAGLDGARSGLFFAFIRLADRLAPPWILWENVDGALSSSGGEDFAVCLEGFTGYRPQVPADGWRSAGVCVGPLRWCVWRVLDAQWFGVAQRRARLFVVAGTGEQPRPEILLEPESVSGDSAPSRTAGEDVARPLGAGTPGGSYRDDLDHGAFGLTVSPALKSRDCKGPSSDGDGDGAPIVAHTLRAEGMDASEDGTGRGVPIVAFGWNKSPSQTMRVDALQADALQASPTSNPAVLAPTLRCGGREQGAGSSYDNTPVVMQCQGSNVGNMGALRVEGADASEDVAHTFDYCLTCGKPRRNYHDIPAAMGGPCECPQAADLRNGALGDVAQSLQGGGMGESRGLCVNAIPHVVSIVPRRLTPRECERLMGWPDDWTLVEGMKDSPRYRMIGNGVVANVSRWIGERIMRCANG